LGITTIFNPLIILYYGIIFRTKFKWHSRKKLKKQNYVKNFLIDKFTDKGISNKTINKLIDNYSKLGNTLFDGQFLKVFLELDKALLHQESKVKTKSE